LPALVAALLLALAACEPAENLDDQAGLLTDDERRRLSTYHDFLRQDHGIAYQVVTATGLGDINAFAVERFEALAVGERGEAGRGLLLVIDAEADLVRLEVGYALEGVYPDAFIAYVEQRQMVPFFRAGRVADGILATSELIIARAQRAEADAGFEGEAWMTGSGGAGATTAAEIGTGRTLPQRQTASGEFAAGRTPFDTLAAYLAAMRARNGPAQMDNVLRSYRRCGTGSLRRDGDLAVIRYPIDQRLCAPWFFRQLDDGWALDLTMMQRVIRFGRDNSWHFDPGVPHAYGFAFDDWRLDARGYPQARR
jgi:uncharacterized protein